MNWSALKRHFSGLMHVWPLLGILSAAIPLAASTAALSGDDAGAPPDAGETIITPLAGWPTIGFRDLWHYRDLIIQLTLRNIKVRYKQTMLGVAWAVLQPAALVEVLLVQPPQVAVVEVFRSRSAQGLA